MGLFNKIKENNENRRNEERQRLMNLTEKELMVEIVLQLEEINRKSAQIQRTQILYSD